MSSPTGRRTDTGSASCPCIRKTDVNGALTAMSPRWGAVSLPTGLLPSQGTQALAGRGNLDPDDDHQEALL